MFLLCLSFFIRFFIVLLQSERVISRCCKKYHGRNAKAPSLLLFEKIFSDDMYITLDNTYNTCYYNIARKEMKYREVVKMIKADGWYEIGQVGSHH